MLGLKKILNMKIEESLIEQTRAELEELSLFNFLDYYLQSPSCMISYLDRSLRSLDINPFSVRLISIFEIHYDLLNKRHEHLTSDIIRTLNNLKEPDLIVSYLDMCLADGGDDKFFQGLKVVFEVNSYIISESNLRRLNISVDDLPNISKRISYKEY